MHLFKERVPSDDTSYENESARRSTAPPGGSPSEAATQVYGWRFR
jgi:hypothetical protein